MKSKISFLILLLPCLVFAFVVEHPWHIEKEIIDKGAKTVKTQWKFVDKGWRPRMRPGKTWDGEFIPYDDHYDKWVKVTTNETIRPNSVPSRSIYRDTVTNLEHQVEAQRVIIANLEVRVEQAERAVGGIERAKYAVDKTISFYDDRQAVEQDPIRKECYIETISYLRIIRSELVPDEPQPNQEESQQEEPEPKPEEEGKPEPKK